MSNEQDLTEKELEQQNEINNETVRQTILATEVTKAQILRDILNCNYDTLTVSSTLQNEAEKIKLMANKELQGVIRRIKKI